MWRRKRERKGRGRSSSPGWVAQLVRVLSSYIKVTGFDPWSVHKQESTNECINRWDDKLILSLIELKNNMEKKRKTFLSQWWF